MHRSWQQLALILGIATAACRQSPVKAAANQATAARVAMDSAEIDRLCLAPDSVRAGQIGCVLKDQSAPRQVRRQSPPPPR